MSDPSITAMLEEGVLREQVFLHQRRIWLQRRWLRIWLLCELLTALATGLAVGGGLQADTAQQGVLGAVLVAMALGATLYLFRMCVHQLDGIRDARRDLEDARDALGDFYVGHPELDPSLRVLRRELESLPDDQNG